MSDYTNGISVPIGADISQFAASMKAASSIVRVFATNTNAQLKLVSGQMTKMSATVSAFSASMLKGLADIPTRSKATKAAIGDLSVKVSAFSTDMSAAFGVASSQLNALNAPVKNLSTSFSTLGASARAASGSIAASGDSMTAAGGKAGFLITMIKRIASAAGVLLVFAFARALKSVASFYSEFEASMQKIVALVGIPQKVVNEWASSLPDVARKTATGLQELGEALYYITSAGIRGKNSLTALSQVAMASAAGLGDMTSIARTVVSAVNAWGKESLSAEKATGILINTVKEGNLRTEELASSFSKVIPVAAALEISMQEVGGAIAFLSRSGMNAATATTGLRRLMLALASPSKEASKELDRIGLSAEFLIETLKGPEGLQDALRYLAVATEGNFARIEAAIPAIRALGPALTLARGSVSDFVSVFGGVAAANPRTTMEAFAVGAETVKRKTDELSAAWDAFKLVLGGVMSSGIINFLERLTDYVDKARRALIAYQEFNDRHFATDKNLAKWFGDAPSFHETPLAKFLTEASSQLTAFKNRWIADSGERFYPRDFTIDPKVLEAEALALEASQIRVKNLSITRKEADEEAKRIDAAAIVRLNQRINAELEQARLDEERIAAELKKAKAIEATADAAEEMRKANKIIDDAIAGGANLFDLWLKFPRQLHLVTRGGKDLTVTLGKIEKQTIKTAKEEANRRDEQEREKKTLADLISSFNNYNDVLSETNPELRTMISNEVALIDEMIKAGASIDEVKEAIKRYKAEVKIAKDRGTDLEKEIEEIVKRFEEAKRSVDGLSKALSNFLTQNYSNSLYSLLTGDFDSLVDTYKTFGEDLASALADGLADVFSYDFEGELNDYLAGLKLKDPEAWSALDKGVKIAGGLAGAYGMYQTMRDEGMSTGEGALSGAALGAQIGSAFPGYGTAIGAAIGAVAGAIMANSISQSKDQFWIDVGSQYEGGSYVTETDLPSATIEKFQDDMMAIIRVTQDGLMDIAELFASKELFAGLSEAFKNLTFMVGGRTADMQALMDTILTDEVPAHVLRKARKSFAKAFQDIGFGKLFRGAWAQMMELPGDEALALFEKVAAGAIALSEALDEVSFEELINDLDMSAWEAFEKRMTDSFSQIDALYEKMINQLDLGAAADDAAAIAQLIEDARAAELQMLQQIKQAQEAINSGWDSIGRQLDLYDRSDYKKMEYFSYELTDALALLQNSLSPDQIQKNASDMQTAFQNMMGLIDEGDWDKRFADWKFNDPVGRAFLDIEGLNELLGFDVNAFEGTTREFFQALMEALKGETDDAFQDAFDRVEEWANALEEAAIRTADALNELALTLTDGTSDDNPKSLVENISDPIVLTMNDIAAADMNMQNMMLESSHRTHDLLAEQAINPPNVIVDIDGTLQPLIAMIDARIEAAGINP